MYWFMLKKNDLKQHEWLNRNNTTVTTDYKKMQKWRWLMTAHRMTGESRSTYFHDPNFDSHDAELKRRTCTCLGSLFGNFHQPPRPAWCRLWVRFLMYSGTATQLNWGHTQNRPTLSYRHDRDLDVRLRRGLVRVGGLTLPELVQWAVSAQHMHHLKRNGEAAAWMGVLHLIGESTSAVRLSVRARPKNVAWVFLFLLLHSWMHA